MREIHKAISTDPSFFCYCTSLTHVPELLGVKWVMPRSTADLLLSWKRGGLPKHSSKAWNTVPAGIWRSIWKERIRRCLKDRRAKFGKSNLIIFLVSCWCKIDLVEDAETLL